MDLPPVTARTGVDCKLFGCWPHQAAVPAICADRDLCNPCGQVQPVCTTSDLCEAKFPAPRHGQSGVARYVRCRVLLFVPFAPVLLLMLALLRSSAFNTRPWLSRFHPALHEMGTTSPSGPCC